MKGEANVSMKKPEICGPGGTGASTAGPKGMRQTYKQTGNPGKGSK